MGYEEKPYNPDAPYAESVAVTDPEAVEPVEPEVEPRSGWNAYRGSEQHGVQQTAAVPLPLDTWQKDAEDEVAGRFVVPPLKQQDPLPVVEVWSKEQTKRVVARTRAITLARNAWTEVLGINHRRVMVSFSVSPSPQKTDSSTSTHDLTLAASAARTTSGNGSAVDVTGVDNLVIQLDVTAASGTTPTLDVVIEDSVDGTNWNEVAAFAQKTAAGREVLRVTNPTSDQIRARWTIGGTTPSFTFSVLAYAEPAVVTTGTITKDNIYFQADNTELPVALCPRIQDGGQQVGLYQFMFTNKLYMYAETTSTDYVVNVFEEYEIEV